MEILGILIFLALAGGVAFIVIKKKKNSDSGDEPGEPNVPDIPQIPVTPFNWQFNLKNQMHHELNCWNSGWNKGGFFAGAYTAYGGHGGDIRVFKSDQNCENWRPFFSVDSNKYESVSSFIPNADFSGINVLTEVDDGAEIWWIPNNNTNHAKLIFKFDPQHMYGFANTGCKKHGWAAICGNKNRGGKLAKYDGGWKYFTPEFKDNDGHPMLIWDAIEFNGKIVCGGVRGKGEYHNLNAGSIGILNGDHWIIKKLQPQGTAAILQFNILSTDPGYLYMTTSYGEVWKTNDLENFNLVFTSELHGRQCDIYFYDIEGHPVCVSSKGLVYDCYQRVLDLRNDCEWISVIKPEDGKKFLGGSYRKKSEVKGTYGVTLTYN